MIIITVQLRLTVTSRNKKCNKNNKKSNCSTDP